MALLSYICHLIYLIFIIPTIITDEESSEEENIATSTEKSNTDTKEDVSGEPPLDKIKPTTLVVIGLGGTIALTLLIIICYCLYKCLCKSKGKKRKSKSIVFTEEMLKPREKSVLKLKPSSNAASSYPDSAASRSSSAGKTLLARSPLIPFQSERESSSLSTRSGNESDLYPEKKDIRKQPIKPKGKKPKGIRAILPNPADQSSFAGSSSSNSRFKS